MSCCSDPDGATCTLCSDTAVVFVDYQSIQANLSERLEKALGSCAPLLREVFIEFAPYLTQTLLGTKGQELLRGGKYGHQAPAVKYMQLHESCTDITLTGNPIGTPKSSAVAIQPYQDLRRV